MIQVLLVLAGIVVACFLLTVLVGAPYVPTKRRDIVAVFDDLYKISEKDLLVDIGSGDGVVLREAARRGARAIGYEINPFLVMISHVLCRKFPHTQTKLANFWHISVPRETTVIYTFGESRDIERMARWVERQATYVGRPLYFLSYAFTLKNHKPVRTSATFALYKIQPLQGHKAQV